MSELEDLRRRVDALEAVYRGVDTETSDNTASIRATHHLVQALAITQGQHGEWLQQLRDDVAPIKAQLAELRAGQRQIVDLLTRLIEQPPQ